MAKASPQLPIHGRITLDQFLAYSGWQITPGANRAGMQTALDFYQDKIPRAVLTAQVGAASPLAPKTVHGPVIKLVELMQAIDFSQPVSRYTAQKNERFKQVRRQNEAALDKPRGNWFTFLSTQVNTLGLPGNQSREHVYVVDRPVEGLKTTVADAFTWTRPQPNETTQDKYLRGGAMQFFVWEPWQYFRLA
jgi:hypothetical protein